MRDRVGAIIERYARKRRRRRRRKKEEEREEAEARKEKQQSFAIIGVRRLDDSSLSLSISFSRSPFDILRIYFDSTAVDTAVS